MILTQPTQDEEVVTPDLFEPTPMQRCFLSCPADQVLYGGAAAGGKTTSLVMAGMAVCMAHPGARAIYFRLTFDDLQQQIDDTKRFVPEDTARFHENRHRWEFKSRKNPVDGKPRESYFNFRYLKSESDALGHFSREYDLLIFDEATQFSQKTIEMLQTRNRTSLPGARARMLMGTNPGGVGHLYLLQNWVRPLGDDFRITSKWDWSVMGADGKPGRWIRTPPDYTGPVEPFVVWHPHPNEEQRRAGEASQSRCFIPAKVDDNPHADPSYKSRLMALQDDQLKRALLYGDWDVFSGQAFGEFQEHIHVRNDIEIEPHWRKWRSIDWGWKPSATVIYWYAYNPEKDQVITYRELHLYETSDKEICEMIQSNTPKLEYIDFTVADPAMWAGGSNDRGMSRADIFARYGVPLTRGINKRPTGFARVKQALTINRNTLSADWPNGEPYWVCTPDCFNLRRTLPTLVFDKSGEDIDHSRVADDHCYDCLAGSTLILTSTGHRRIDSIKPGDHVVTRQGWRPVTDAWMQHPQAPTFAVHLENGVRVRGTANHPFWVEGKGWTLLCDLRYGDMLIQHEQAISKGSQDQWLRRLSNTTVMSTAATRTALVSTIDATSSVMRCAIRMLTFIGSSGSNIMVSSPPVGTYIIGTETTPTTRSRTWKLSVPVLTSESTIRIARPVPRAASIAEPNTRRSISRTISGSARTLASRLGGGLRRLTTWRRIVLSAEPSLRRIATTEPRLVPVRVEGVWPADAAMVYDLSVEGAHEFFANGVLVHNSLRYGLLATPAFFGMQTGLMRPLVYRAY